MADESDKPDDIAAPTYRSPKDIPHPTSKEIKRNLIERELAEGFVGLNQGWAPGLNPGKVPKSPRNPNADWDPVNKRFISGTGYFDRPDWWPHRR